MVGEIGVKYCPICDEDTDHQKGIFKTKKIEGELFHLNTSLHSSLKKVSVGYKDFVVGENNGVMNGDTPDEYVETRKGGVDFEELFSPQVRSLKCTQCLHLIKISRFP